MASETAESVMARFLDYLVVNCGPENAARRAGAERQDIDRLMEFIRFPIPASYLGYLNEFGERDDCLKMADDGNSNIKKLIYYYSHIVSSWSTKIPPGVVYISTPGLTGGRCLCYPVDSSVAEPAVAVTDGLVIDHMTASNFERYLYRQAFTRLLSSKSVVPSTARRYRAELIPELTGVVQREGFDVCWFSDTYQLCCMRMEQIILALYQGSSTIVYFSGRDREDSEQLRLHFSNALSLKNTTPKM